MAPQPLQSYREAFTASLARGGSYASARRDADRGLTNGHDVSSDATAAIADLEDATLEWTSERPPLQWYSMALSLFAVRRLPSDLLIALAQAANYYGDSQLALAATDQMGNPDTSVALALCKLRARAHRNAGEFGRARAQYQRALSICIGVRSLDADLAYFLMLFAKLCHDYQQRQGWYREYHRIAAQRFRRDLLLAGDAPARKRIAQWLRLAEDSTAKSTASDHPAAACRVFLRCLRAPDINAETRARFTAHLLETRIIQAGRARNWKALTRSLVEFVRLIDDLERSGNIRAICVRKAQYLRLSREFLFVEPDFLKWSPASRRLIEGEWHDIGRTALAQARKLGDLKTVVGAAVELACWPQAVHAHTGRAPVVSDDPAEMLASALRSLTESDSPIASLMHVVIARRSGLELKDMKWDAAAVGLQQALAFDLSLRDALRQDEHDLLVALRPRSAARDGVVHPEFRALTRPELVALLSAVRVDYGILLERLLATGDQIRNLQKQQLTRDFGITLSLTRDFRFHSLKDQLNLLAKLRDCADVRLGLGELSDWLDRWTRQEQAVFKTELIDLDAHVRTAVRDFPALQNYREIVSFHESLAALPGRVHVDPRFVPLLLENLILNASQAATRTGVSHLNIRIGAVSDWPLVRLWVEDNAGDVDGLMDRIESLNLGEAVPEPMDRPMPRHGLGIIKRFLHLCGRAEKWAVTRLPDEVKRLAIPIGLLDGV